MVINNFKDQRVLLPFPLILLHRLRGDSSGGFGTVGGLNVGRRRGDRPPRFAACHSKRYCTTRQQCQNDRLDNFVDLLIAHTGLGFCFKRAAFGMSLSEPSGLRTDDRRPNRSLSYLSESDDKITAFF